MPGEAPRSDLDHTVAWPLGPTAAENLACLCRHHHRLRHQAPGWRLCGLADGGLEWTTPGRTVITTHPIRFGADDDVFGDRSAAEVAVVAGGSDLPPAEVWLDEPPF
jgi:hypothetical protein